MDNLYHGLQTKQKYAGDLLSSENINLLNKMCGGAEIVGLGTKVNALLTASKNSTTI